MGAGTAGCISRFRRLGLHDRRGGDHRRRRIGRRPRADGVGCAVGDRRRGVVSLQNPVTPPEVGEGALQGFDLSGRRAIVYGAEKPVATAIVQGLREAGAAVGVTSANTDGTSLFRLKKAADGGPNESVDLSNGTNIQVATRKISKELGGLDAAIVVPQLYHAAPIRKTLDADIQRVLMANLGGAYAAFRSASREFRGKPGRLIAVLDASAVRGLTNLSIYSAAQSGVIGLVRALSQELAPAGTTVNAIVVGWSDSTQGRGPSNADENLLLRFIPMRRFGEAWEAAPLAVYLASEASGYITGQTIQVDGGVLKHL
ncbi:MAG: SDR family oxidoreductase [Chloroflexi bacterium]|nr:SDR family oxidoreductase [Chloroflexota bacterium]MYB23460.1 SDR family oxidoreductase [Chloroflexota bacterium]MYF22413.1 SDR family oxidoreductase [Chloroflexota bacterium]MYI03974.1 SDR family oxidoreductase [Chloroflexota bacterium]